MSKNAESKQCCGGGDHDIGFKRSRRVLSFYLEAGVEHNYYKTVNYYIYSICDITISAEEHVEPAVIPRPGSLVYLPSPQYCGAKDATKRTLAGPKDQGTMVCNTKSSCAIWCHISANITAASRIEKNAEWKMQITAEGLLVPRHSTPSPTSLRRGAVGG